MRLPIPRPAVAGVLLCAAVLGSSACVETFDARSLGTKTTLSARAVEQPQGEPFKVTKKAVYLLWGFAAAAKPDLERALAGQIAGDAEIANLRVVVKSGFGDVLVTAITAGLVVPRTITYEGVVVRPGGAPAGVAP